MVVPVHHRRRRRPFLVDTGASYVLIPAASRRRPIHRADTRMMQFRPRTGSSSIRS
jgi:hypothetical protein